MKTTPIYIEKSKRGFEGKKHSDLSRDKISSSKRGVTNTKSRKLSEQDLQDIKKMLDSGESVTSISQKYSVSRTTLYRYFPTK